MSRAGIPELVEWMETNVETSGHHEDLQSLLAWYEAERKRAAIEVGAACEVGLDEVRPQVPGIFVKVEVCMDTLLQGDEFWNSFKRRVMARINKRAALRAVRHIEE